MNIPSFFILTAVLACSITSPAFADDQPAETARKAEAPSGKQTIEIAGGKYECTIDTSETPDLTSWAEKELAPVVKEWYPKLVEMLPSEGFEAPAKINIVFKKDMRGVAATGGTRISCAADWFRPNLEGEAKGAVVHELIHVVQQYGRSRRNNPDATRAPGWFVEGLADYIRWFAYEPQSHGTDIVLRKPERAHYDSSYRVTADFLNWVVGNYDHDLVKKLNAAAREGKYDEALWKQYTGKTVQELGDEWKTNLSARAAAVGNAPETSKINRLTEAQQKEGWKLLFNGKDLSGWHNFKTNTVREGWQVKDGLLACIDPHNAGDLCSKDEFGAFELQLDYNISVGGNSGIMYHVTEKGRAAWASGPEFQLEDNKKAGDPIRCGWLYGLYQPPIDPSTGKPLDATKAAGQWNHVRLLVTPEKCEHEINGVKYFDYVIGSDDFNARVAKSKFAKMPLFAKSKTGAITLQGDHGQVSFRNIMIKSLDSK
jgi:hypothetical protein